MTPSQEASMHWQRTVAILALGALAGCAHPAFFNAVTPATREATYACTTREMTKLKYLVDVPDPETGVTIGDRAGEQHGPENMGHADHDRLTATVVAVDSTSVRLHIDATTVRVTTFARQSREQTVTTTDAVRGDAVTVMNACAGTVTRGSGT